MGYKYRFKDVKKDLMGHYKYLYENYERKSVAEIAEYLDISEKTVRDFIDNNYSGKNSLGKFSKFDIIILTTTKFGSKSKYLKDQNELIGLIIRRQTRRLMKLQEEKLEKSVEKVKTKAGKMM